MAEIKNSIQESIKEEVEKRRAYVGSRYKIRQNDRIRTCFIYRRNGYIYPETAARERIKELKIIMKRLKG